MQASTSADIATLAEDPKGKSDEQTPLLRQFITKTKRQASEWYVIALLFFVMLSVASVFAPLLQFYTEIFCNRYYGATGDDQIDGDDIPIQDCSIPEIQETVASAQAVIQTLNYGSSLLTVSYYGHLTDRKGNLHVIRLSILGLFCMVGCIVSTALFQHYIGIGLIFLGPLLRGLLAGDSSFMAAIQGYISDCTSTTRRTTVFGRMMASMLGGVMVGANISSAIIKNTGDINKVFYMSFFVLGFSILCTFLIPEDPRLVSSAEHKEVSFWDQINAYKSIKILFSVEKRQGSRYALPLVALSQFMLAVIALPPFLLYAMLEFHWTAYEGGYFVSLMALLRLLMLLVIFPLLTKLFMGPTEQEQWKFNIWVLRITCAMEGFGLLVVAMSVDLLAFWVSQPLERSSQHRWMQQMSEKYWVLWPQWMRLHYVLRNSA
ncbi:major facilitator superfamily domain-containing protein [Fennellomyces sp. T-0311]|nr:major facilitator superfamily domain-containing protein [Fennellomyces sp. T-0311]